MVLEPLVSIVIPCHAASIAQAALLDETLGTVDQQLYRNYEVIVVDDGSLVDVHGIAAAHNVDMTIRRSNTGCAAARNAGIAASRGEYFVFLDSDDHLLPRALEAGVRALGEHPDAGFAVGAREEMTYEGNPVAWEVPSVPDRSDLYATLLGYDWFIIPPSSAMFRRGTVEKVGGFREPWGADDLDFYLRVAHRYPAYCFNAPSVTRYRRSRSGSSRDGERMLRSVRAVYERHRPLVRGDSRLESAHARGLQQLTEIFVENLVENSFDRFHDGNWPLALRSLVVLARESPTRLLELLKAIRGPRRPQALGLIPRVPEFSRPGERARRV